jgi:hypothetical protein
MPQCSSGCGQAKLGGEYSRGGLQRSDKISDVFQTVGSIPKIFHQLQDSAGHHDAVSQVRH